MPIEPSGTLSRYLFNRIRNYLRPDNSVKRRAFEPNRNNKTSVYQTAGLPENDKWDIGRDVASESDRSLCGRAEILASVITNTSLDVVESPPRGHADIIGWPQDKEDMKALALELADAAQGYRL